jgi:hypothetical protein
MAGVVVVQAMLTDSWEGVRHKIARLFGRGRLDPVIERRLDATREQLAAAPPSELERLRAALAAQWQTRFEDLLADHPDAEAELAALVDDLKPVPAPPGGHSAAAARDMTIVADRGGVAAGVIHGDVTSGPTMPDPAYS